jgi:hypothetical protein
MDMAKLQIKSTYRKNQIKHRTRYATYDVLGRFSGALRSARALCFEVRIQCVRLSRYTLAFWLKSCIRCATISHYVWTSIKIHRFECRSLECIQNSNILSELIECKQIMHIRFKLMQQ